MLRINLAKLSANVATKNFTSLVRGIGGKKDLTDMAELARTRQAIDKSYLFSQRMEPGHIPKGKKVDQGKGGTGPSTLILGVRPGDKPFRKENNSYKVLKPKDLEVPKYRRRQWTIGMKGGDEE